MLLSTKLYFILWFNFYVYVTQCFLSYIDGKWTACGMCFLTISCICTTACWKRSSSDFFSICWKLIWLNDCHRSVNDKNFLRIIKNSPIDGIIGMPNFDHNLNLHKIQLSRKRCIRFGAIFLLILWKIANIFGKNLLTDFFDNERNVTTVKYQIVVNSNVNFPPKKMFFF